MKNYLIAGFLWAIPANLFGMFLDIDDISRSATIQKDGSNYSETISIVKEGPDTANFVFSLKGRVPGLFFGERLIPLAKVIITISESSTKTNAQNKISVSFDFSSPFAQTETQENGVKVAKIQDFARKWSESRENFSKLFFGKDKQQLEKNVAESKAMRFYKGLSAVEEDATFDVDAFIQSLSEKTEEPVLDVQLAPKLEELAHSLKRLSAFARWKFN